MSLRFAPGMHRVVLRELTGHDERFVRDTSTAAAIALLDQLVEPAGESWRTARLTASDRDRLLAAVYRLTYGDRIESTARCQRCDSPFDVLRTRRRDGGAGLSPATGRAAARRHIVCLGARFRLPVGEDSRMAVCWLKKQGPRSSNARPIVSPADRAAVDEGAEAIAPVLDLDLDTACPECGDRQVIHFDMQFYLLRALQLERPQITREIHRIANAYGWSLHDILGLRRSERRAFVDLIESESPSRRRLP